MNIISSIKNYLSPNQDISMNNSADNTINDVIIDTTFKLPIEYLDNNDIKTLPTHVSNDLELILTPEPDDKNMYEHLFNPTNVFAKQLLSAWNNKYTTNTHFLKDSQKIIQNMNLYKQNLGSNVDPEEILTIWKNTKQNNMFCEKYNYLDWDMLKHLNYSSSFLQILSCIHILSPVISFLLPFLLLIFPFIILKIQGVSITSDIYVETLKLVAKNHFIGKMLFNSSNINWEKMIYICFTIGLYIFQIYQNITTCRRFYNNIININKDLEYLKEYTNHSINSMEQFMQITQNYQTYTRFNENLFQNINSLYELKIQLDNIDSFKLSFNKFMNIGYMLKSYYIIHDNKEFENTLRFSVGFHGYLNNLCQLNSHISHGLISFATFTNNNDCSFKQQYYPAITHTKPICNDIDLGKNMIISAPNKAGKTTIIKSSLINLIFSQQTGCGFYESATITPYSHIHSYLNIPDTSGRDSLFQAESRRCKDIIDTINENSNDRHFCIFDELYSGTNPDEAVKSGSAFLKYLQKFSNVRFILTTHYKEICKKFNKSALITNHKMDVSINENGTFNYKYKLVKGISKIKGGIRVLKDMEYPDEIIQSIEN